MSFVVQYLCFLVLYQTFPCIGSSGSRYDMSLVVRKPDFGVSDQVIHKPGCTVTEDGKKLEISYLGSGGIVLSV